MSVTRPGTVSLSPEIRAEAAAWVARLHGSGRTASLETALRTWLAASPVHARAFELATEAWELGGAVPAAALPRESVRSETIGHARAGSGRCLPVRRPYS